MGGGRTDSVSRSATGPGLPDLVWKKTPRENNSLGLDLDTGSEKPNARSTRSPTRRAQGPRPCAARGVLDGGSAVVGSP